MGRPVTRTDAFGCTTRVTYDRLGQRLSVRFPDGTSTQATYEAGGQPVRLVDALGRATEMSYSGMGVLLRLTLPDGQTWRFAYTSTERLKEIKNPC